MSALIRHTNSEPQRPLWKTALYLFGLIIGFQLTLVFISRLPKLLAGPMNSVVVVAIIAGTIYFVKRKMAKYTYLLIEDEIIFYKQVGKKETKVLKVKVNEIEWIRPIDKVKKLTKCPKTYILSCRTKGKGVYIGQFKQNNTSLRFIIQPSDALYNEIQLNL